MVHPPAAVRHPAVAVGTHAAGGAGVVVAAAAASAAAAPAAAAASAPASVLLLQDPHNPDPVPNGPFGVMCVPVDIHESQKTQGVAQASTVPFENQNGYTACAYSHVLTHTTPTWSGQRPNRGQQQTLRANATALCADMVNAISPTNVSKATWSGHGPNQG